MINDDVSLTTMRWFRLAALIEGISFLVLLFIAMPFKYLADEPRPVLYVGWMHGFLFVVYGLLLLKVWIQYRWSFQRAFLAFLASLIPLGTFVLDKRLKKEYFGG